MSHAWVVQTVLLQLVLLAGHHLIHICGVMDKLAQLLQIYQQATIPAQ